MKIISETADTKMIQAPEVKSKLYENQRPVIVKKDAISPEINIMLYRDDERFCAMYIGIVKRAITKIRPTTFMAITTVSADNISISV